MRSLNQIEPTPSARIRSVRAVMSAAAARVGELAGRDGVGDAERVGQFAGGLLAVLGAPRGVLLYRQPLRRSL